MTLPAMKTLSCRDAGCDCDYIAKGEIVAHISTLAELGRMLQCDIKTTKMGNKTIRPVIIPIQKLIEFLLSSIPGYIYSKMARTFGM